MTLRFVHRFGVALVSHLALFCAMALNCSAQLFPTLVSYDSGGGQPHSLAVGDFNRDGIQDIAVANACVDSGCSDGTGTIGILLGNSDGTFQAAQTYSSGYYIAVSIAVGDVNGDGKLDLAVDNCGTRLCVPFEAGFVSILLGNGDGTFQTATTYPAGGTNFVALTDLNGDGRADAVVSSTGGGYITPTSITVLLADATGALRLSGTYPVEDVATNDFSRSFIIAADLNADGKTDLVVTTGCLTTNRSTVAVLFGNGDGTFLPAVFLKSGGAQASSVSVADLNQDGLKDLVVSNRCGSTCNVGNVAVFLANVDGSFPTTPTYISNTGFANHVAVADVNQDGIADLVVADGCPATYPLSVTCQDENGNSIPGAVEVLLGNGDGTFQSSQSYQSGGDSASFVAVGDFNHDGKADVVVVNEVGPPSPNPNGSVAVLLGALVANTVTTLAASPGNPAYGQTVTLTATVTSGGHNSPTGSVTLMDGATILGTVNLISGQTSLNLILALGPHSLTASYPGNGNFHGSSSSPLLLSVSKAGTQTLLTSSPNSSLVSQSVTFTATIVPASGTGPTGTVSFFDGTKLLGSASVSGGTAVLNTSSLKQATHSITATYSGDGNFTGSTSDVLSQVVEFATATSLVSSLNPSIFGLQVIFNATVTAAGGTPNGSVTFTANNKSLGKVKLAGGIATLGTTGLKVGSTEVIATYNGSAGFRVSSGAVVQVVNGAATSTAITGSSLNPSTYGDVVTFTAVVSSNGGTPAGNVRFKVGSTLLGPATLSDGVATLTTSAGQLPGGADSIVAIYNGTAQFTGSTSPALVQTVNQAISTTTLISSPNPASLGQTVTFTATVSGTFAIPAGKVRFRDGTTSLGVVSLSNGVAVYTTSALSRKTHNVSATYEGNLNYLTSSGNVQQVVR